MLEKDVSELKAIEVKSYKYDACPLIFLFFIFVSFFNCMSARFVGESLGI